MSQQSAEEEGKRIRESIPGPAYADLLDASWIRWARRAILITIVVTAAISIPATVIVTRWMMR
jgi:hypothetical protein